jgi:hypothetical protein
MVIEDVQDPEGAADALSNDNVRFTMDSAVLGLAPLHYSGAAEALSNDNVRRPFPILPWILPPGKKKVRGFCLQNGHCATSVRFGWRRRDRCSCHPNSSTRSITVG